MTLIAIIFYDLIIKKACRGSKADPGVTLPPNMDVILARDEGNRRIPTQADFLIIHSTAPGMRKFFR